MPLLLIAALAFGGYYVYTNYLGGSVTGPTTSPEVPDVNAPDADDVGRGIGKGARGAEEGAKTAADTIAGLDPAVWRMLGLLLVVACAVWVWKDPKRRSIALGLAVVGLLVFFVIK